MLFLICSIICLFQSYNHVFPHMKSIILHDYFHVQDDEMVEFSLSVWAVAALKPKNVNTKLCLLIFAAYSNSMIRDSHERQQPRIYASACQLGGIPLLRVDREVSNATISIERGSLIKVLLITVMLRAPLGVAIVITPPLNKTLISSWCRENTQFTFHDTTCRTHTVVHGITSPSSFCRAVCNCHSVAECLCVIV